MALQALSEVAQTFFSGDTSTNLSVSMNIKDVFGHVFHIKADNRMLLQRVEIPSEVLPNKVDISTSGSGCALLQVVL